MGCSVPRRTTYSAAMSALRNRSKGPALTPWLSGSVEPIHEGVYRRRSPAGPYSCWSAQRWYGDQPSPRRAAAQRETSRHQSEAWRGLVAGSDETCGTCRGQTVIDRGYDVEADVDLIGECPDC